MTKLHNTAYNLSQMHVSFFQEQGGNSQLDTDESICCQNIVLSGEPHPMARFHKTQERWNLIPIIILCRLCSSANHLNLLLCEFSHKQRWRTCIFFFFVTVLAFSKWAVYRNGCSKYWFDQLFIDIDTARKERKCDAPLGVWALFAQNCERGGQRQGDAFGSSICQLYMTRWVNKYVHSPFLWFFFCCCFFCLLVKE